MYYTHQVRTIRGPEAMQGGPWSGKDLHPVTLLPVAPPVLPALALPRSYLSGADGKAPTQSVFQERLEPLARAPGASSCSLVQSCDLHAVLNEIKIQTGICSLTRVWDCPCLLYYIGAGFSWGRPTEKGMPTYRDVDALALDPQRVQGDDDRLAINHVNKKRVKTKNAEVVFDPKQHKCEA